MPKEENTEIEEGKVVEIEKDSGAITPAAPKSVIVDPKQLQDFIIHEKEIRKILTDYIDSELKENIDYGKIKMTSKSGKEYESKPSLFKPGSEKFCAIMHLRPTFEKDDDTWEMSGRQNGLFCYVCKLVNEKGEVVGEGRGAADVNEKQNVNVAIKIAQKRAQVDAVIRTGQLSDFFTQDLEDLPSTGDKASSSGTKRMTPSQQAFQKYWTQLANLKSKEEATLMEEAIDTEVELSVKQKGYLKDMVNKKVGEVQEKEAQQAIDDIPF